jgi:hypothetical protein
MPSPWLTREELAERLHVTPKTLGNWKLEGCGPAPVKVGRRLLHKLATVEKWKREQKRLSRAG